MTPLIRKVLVTLLDFQRRRPALEKQAGAERVAELAERLEVDIERLWTLMAGLQALGKPNATADASHPGYVEVRVADSPVESIHVPFHLVPATPDLPTLAEVLSLAAHVRVGEVDGHRAMICLSGSTVILNDVLRVGDIDFCEYVPAAVAPAFLTAAFAGQVSANDARYCTVSIRLKTRAGGAGESQLIDVRQRSTMTAEQLDALGRFVATAGNGKSAHVMSTQFAGVTEVTNWLIIFQPPLENDPGSKLSFAHQEAPLSTFAHRPLHTVEALAAYLNFLRIEMETHGAGKPVKAVKRAIPWLRLFRGDELLSELLEKARHSGALRCAAVLSKIELLRKYDGMSDLRPDLQALLASLRSEIDTEGGRLFGAVGNLETALQSVVEAFGRDLAGPARPATGRPPLLSQVLSLAEAESNG